MTELKKSSLFKYKTNYGELTFEKKSLKRKGELYGSCRSNIRNSDLRFLYFFFMTSSYIESLSYNVIIKAHSSKQV